MPPRSPPLWISINLNISKPSWLFHISKLWTPLRESNIIAMESNGIPHWWDFSSELGRFPRHWLSDILSPGYPAASSRKAALNFKGTDICRVEATSQAGAYYLSVDPSPISNPLGCKCPRVHWCSLYCACLRTSSSSSSFSSHASADRTCCFYSFCRISDFLGWKKLKQIPRPQTNFRPQPFRSPTGDPTGGVAPPKITPPFWVPTATEPMNVDRRTYESTSIESRIDQGWGGRSVETPNTHMYIYICIV